MTSVDDENNTKNTKVAKQSQQGSVQDGNRTSYTVWEPS